jgi:hypothetical protein
MRLAFNSPSSCLQFLSAGITEVQHHTQLLSPDSEAWLGQTQLFKFEVSALLEEARASSFMSGY